MNPFIAGAFQDLVYKIARHNCDDSRFRRVLGVECWSSLGLHESALHLSYIDVGVHTPLGAILDRGASGRYGPHDCALGALAELVEQPRGAYVCTVSAHRLKR